ncbi:MAG: enoyl-CoA hydratase [Spongiibacteraceae bacterium]
MSEQWVLREDRDGIAIVTLNRPQAMNALSRALTAALANTFRDLQQDQTITAAILTGNGRAFCAGLDLKEIGNNEGKDGLGEIEAADLWGALRGFDRPIIGAINGVALTGGFELALMCDLLIASEDARFADTHARVGVIPGWGLSQLLTRLIGVNRARELSFTGNFLSAAKAEAWGLVNRVVAKEELLPTCLQLAQDMASCDQSTLRAYKKLINDGARLSLSDALVLEDHVHLLTRENSTGDAIAARRGKVMSRGRGQTSE